MEFKILIVDDEKEVAESLSESFAGQGYRILLAGSGDEALAITEREAVDLVLLDLHMPGIPGEEVLRHLKETAPHIKVAVLTGHPEREKAVREIGCDGFLRKPAAQDSLLEIVDSLLKQKDEEELKRVTMGHRLLEATPGDPLARLLIIEPVEALSDRLIAFFRDHRKAKGFYSVEIASDLGEAVSILVGVHPDLVLMDLSAVEDPGKLARALAACEFQPKDYIFCLPQQGREPGKGINAVGSLKGKVWEGDLSDEEAIGALGELVREIALAHALVKR